MKYKRIIPLILPVLVWLLCETFLRVPRFFYSSIALSVLLVVLGVKYLAEKDNWFEYLAAPVFFLAAFGVYATMIASSFWVHAIFLLILWFLFLYFRNLYYFFTRGETNPEWRTRLESTLLAGNFLTIFATASVLFGLPAFLSWSVVLMLPAFAVVVWLLFFQIRSILENNTRREPGLIIISTLVLTEIAWGLSLLPLNFNILGIFLAIDSYLCLMIIRFDSRGVLNRRSLKLPLIISGIVTLLLLFTARWL